MIDRRHEDPDAWEAAATDLWRTLQDAIRAEAGQNTRVRSPTELPPHPSGAKH